MVAKIAGNKKYIQIFGLTKTDIREKQAMSVYVSPRTEEALDKIFFDGMGDY